MNQISRNHLDTLRATVAMPPMSDVAPQLAGDTDEAEILAPDGQERAIGERLAQARKGAKLSKAAVAKAIGRRGAQVISDYETGTSKVRLSTVREIAAATGADVTWLWLGRREPVAQVPPAATTDIALIALCTQHDALLAEADRIGNADILPENADVDCQRLTDEAAAIGQTIATMRATTPAGIVALARSTAAWADGMLVDNDTDPLLKMLFRDSLALETAQPVPAAGPNPATSASTEITAAIAAVAAARAACDHVDATTPGDEEECDASAAVHSDALDACGSVRITTLADASAIAALALRYLGADDISGQADVVTRGLLRSLAAIPSGGAHPDAALLALHDRFIALEAGSRNLQQTIPDDTARAVAQEPITDEQDSIVAQAWELTATTPEGHRARARMLLAWDSELKNGAIERQGIDAEMLWLLVRDLLGEDHADVLQSPDLDTYLQGIEAARSGIVPNPDAEIIALCDQVAAAWEDYRRLGLEEDSLPAAEQYAFGEAHCEPAYERAHFLYNAIKNGPMPQTEGGLRAVARAAVCRAEASRPEDPHLIEMTDPGAELAWKLVGHLAGLEVTPLPVGVA